MEVTNQLISEYPLNEGSVLYSTAIGNVLVGCPPEVLKTLMVKHFPMPDTVVIPSTAYVYGSSLACLEFPFYHFLFIQQGLARGKKFRVMATAETCANLADMLRVTLLGPSLEEVREIEGNLGLESKSDLNLLEQVLKETDFLALKGKDGATLGLEAMVEFVTLEEGDDLVIYDALKDQPEVSFSRTGDDSFKIVCNGESLECDLSVSEPLKPVYEIQGVRASLQEKDSTTDYSIRVFGSSEGFDPGKPANGFLFHVNGSYFMWDCPPFARNHLEHLQIDFSEVDALFVSHVHEDHLDIAQTIDPGRKVKVYTTPEIFHCMLLKLVALMKCSYDEAREYYDFNPIYANQPFELFGSKFEVFYAVHAIPALGLKLYTDIEDREAKVFISGDNLAKRMLDTLEENDIFPTSRSEAVLNLLLPDEKYDVIFVDVGSGPIHADPGDFFAHQSRVAYMHTGKDIEGMPEHHYKVKPGQRFLLQR